MTKGEKWIIGGGIAGLLIIMGIMAMRVKGQTPEMRGPCGRLCESCADRFYCKTFNDWC